MQYLLILDNKKSRGGHIGAGIAFEDVIRGPSFSLLPALPWEPSLESLGLYCCLQAAGPYSSQKKGVSQSAKGAQQLNLSPYVRNSVDFSETSPSELLLTFIGQTVLYDHL